MNSVVAIATLLVAAFCSYGFLASWEPGPGHIYFRIGYAIVGIVCLAIGVAILAQRRRD
jgi:hypothetical protein